MSSIPLIFSLLTLAFLEILLSADNAVVLGVLCQHLPLKLRRRALFIGSISAFILRGAALFFVAFLFEQIWIQFLGAAYLIYLSIRYLTKKEKEPTIVKSYSFWKTVLYIELLDLIFAIDSIVAGIGFIQNDPSKLWIVYVGGMIGLLVIRFAAEIFSKLLDKFPHIETSAYLIIGCVGINLALSVFNFKIPLYIFWAVIIALFLFGFLKGNHLKSKS